MNYLQFQQGKKKEWGEARFWNAFNQLKEFLEKFPSPTEEQLSTLSNDSLTLYNFWNFK